MEWYVKCLRQYADFDGRARRKEYWMFVLCNFAIFIFVSIISFILMNTVIGPFGLILPITYLVAMILPGLAVAVRRLHDTNKSGFYLFLGLIPIVGGIVLLVFYFTEGTRGDNEYGPDPKAENVLS